MQHRKGTCASCGATYEIPASFEHDRAQCRECDGVVEIGPVVGGGSGSESQLEEYVPSGKKRSGPSMKEQLLARRKAAEAASAAPDPEPAPAPRKAAATGIPRAEQPKRASRKASGSGSAKKRTKAKAEPLAEEAAPTKGATKRSRAGGRGKGRSAARGGRSASRDKKKGPPMGVLIGVAVVVVLGVVGFLFKDDLFGSDSTVAAESAKVDPPADLAEAEAPTSPAGGTEDATEEPTDAELGEDDATPAAAAAPKTPAAGAKAAAETPGDEKAAPTSKYDPALVDLASVEDFGPVDGTTTEFFEELEARMVRAMNPDLGKGQTKEWDFLKQHPRKAFPVILNYLKDSDLSTEEGTERGKWATRILEDICNGVNYGWKEHMEDADKAGPGYFEWYNKSVVMKWIKGWRQCEDNLDAWKTMAKLTDAQFAELKRSLGDDAPDSSESSALDLLNED